MEKLTVTLIYCEVTPVFMVTGEDGRPVGAPHSPEKWTLAHRDLATLPAKVAAYEAAATKQANQGKGEEE